MRYIAFLLVSSIAFANPYWDPTKVPKDPKWPKFSESRSLFELNSYMVDGYELMRVQVDWNEAKDTFILGNIVREKSGTKAWAARVKKADEMGSFRGLLKDKNSGELLGYESIGTGQEYRKLTRALTFRLPIPSAPAVFELWGENPQTGVMELMIKEDVSAKSIKSFLRTRDDLEVRNVKASEKSPALVINVYAEGFLKSGRERFFEGAQKIVEVLKTSNFPLFENFEINAVFAVSLEKLGSAKDMGMPIPEKNTFLGLFFPYWQKFGRWYNVVYPTREAKYRDGIGQVPYDYPIALLDDGAYWGIGNYNELTAIPINSNSFRYLLLHEFGHFFGLNEEYEGGGPTELQFAPGIKEPWSPNISFLFDVKNAGIKWRQFVDTKIPLPTPSDVWQENPPVYGAYVGGYADSEPRNHSHKPGFRCMMESGREFCKVCRHAITEKIKRDLDFN